MEILNPVITWSKVQGAEVVSSEADPRHVEIFVSEFGLQDATPVTSLVVRIGGGRLDELSTTGCTSLVARAKYCNPLGGPPTNPRTLGVQEQHYRKQCNNVRGCGGQCENARGRRPRQCGNALPSVPALSPASCSVPEVVSICVL